MSAARPARLSDMPDDVLRAVAEHCAPFSPADRFVKCRLQRGAAAASADLSAAAALRDTSAGLAAAVRAGPAARLHFIGPAPRGFEAAVLDVCTAAGPALRELCLEGVPDLSDALVAALHAACTGLEALFVYRAPAAADAAAMSLAGLERVLARLGPQLRRLRFCGTSCLAAGAGGGAAASVDVGARLLRHCVNLDRLVVDLGWLERPCGAGAPGRCFAPVWQAVGLEDVAAKVPAALLAADDFVRGAAPRGDAGPRPAAAAGYLPYAAGDAGNVYHCASMYAYWLSAMLAATREADGGRLARWVDPSSKVLSLRLDSSDPEFFRDHMHDCGNWDAATQEFRGFLGGPVPAWLAPSPAAGPEPSARSRLTDDSVHRTCVMEFLPLEPPDGATPGSGPRASSPPASRGDAHRPRHSG
jgi:hypothetical protein